MQPLRTALPCEAHIAHIIMRNSRLICGNINDVLLPVCNPRDRGAMERSYREWKR